MDENPNLPDLPEEILIEIFLKVPAKAVGRCRCLSKTWSTKLSTPQFVKLHLTNQQNLLLLRFEDRSLHILPIIAAPISVDTVSREIDFGIAWDQVLCCCSNGLVLLSNEEEELFLVNPTTLKLFKLPTPLSYTKIRRYGLIYDSSSDDFKVVLLTYVFAGLGRVNRAIDVYSVKSGVWRRVVDSHHCRVVGGTFTAFLNGAVHGYDTCVIEAFDLADGVLREIPAPPDHDKYTDSYDHLQVLQGCLCLLKSLKSGDIEIWMMKHYGLPDSWTKFTISTNKEVRIDQPLCFIGDREIMFDDYKLGVYNFEEGTTKDMVVHGDPTSFSNRFIFVDSLVSPNHQY